MGFASLNDIESALRSGQVSSRQLHEMWDQRQPVADAGTRSEAKTQRGDGKQIPWIQENPELALLFTDHALRCEEFLLVCDASRETLRFWTGGDEGEKTQLVRVTQHFAEALTRLGSTRDAAKELLPCAADDFKPRLSARFRAEILLQLGDILREESQHTTARAARGFRRAQQAAGLLPAGAFAGSPPARCAEPGRGGEPGARRSGVGSA